MKDRNPSPGRSKIDALREMMEEIDYDCTLARTESKSSQGLAALMRLKLSITDQLYAEMDRERALRAAEEATAPMSEDDVIDATICDLAALPDPMLDRVLNGLVMAGRGAALRRCAPASLRVVGED
jgi:hypothetical protein